MSALFGKNADELEAVEKSHAMADYGAQDLGFRNFGNGELERDHFSGAKLAGDDRSQAIFGDFETATMNAKISLLPQDLDDQGQLGAVASVTSCGGLVHVSSCSSCLSGKAPGVDAKRTVLSSQKLAGLARGGL
jgi:hypothetical protein